MISELDTNLHHAAENGNTAIVNSLLKHDVDVNIQDNNGRTCFHRAAEKGHTDIVNTLLEHGADANIKDNYGRSPLHRAAFNNHKTIVDSLLERGADANLKNDFGHSPLHSAAENGHTDIVLSLLEHGADINSKDGVFGRTCIHWAAADNFTDLFYSLLEHGADANIKDDDGHSPLHSAAENGHTDLFYSLLERGVDANTKNKDGHSPLHSAAENGHTAIVKSLVYCLLLKDPDANKPTGLALHCWDSVKKDVKAIYDLLGKLSNQNKNDTIELISIADGIIDTLPKHLQPLIEQIALKDYSEDCPLAREVLKSPLITLPDSIVWNLIQYLNIKDCINYTLAYKLPNTLTAMEESFRFPIAHHYP